MVHYPTCFLCLQLLSPCSFSVPHGYLLLQPRQQLPPLTWDFHSFGLDNLLQFVNLLPLSKPFSGEYIESSRDIGFTVLV